MGRTRTRQQEGPRGTGAQAAVAVALVESAGASQQAFVASVAPLLLPLMPTPLLADAERAGDVAEGLARLLFESEAVTVPSAGFARTAAMEAISYRAAYAGAAVKRLSVAVVGAEPGERGGALKKAIEAERRHLAAHLDATRRRLAGARATEGMIGLHGWVLSWNHGATKRPEEPRPTHESADGANFDLRRGIPAYTGALPGVWPECSCAWGPPNPNGRMLT